MPARLNLTTIPFRSSRLAAPPSPFTPLTPITPKLPQRTYSALPNTELTQHIPAPTRAPLRWLWVRHLCNRSYSLGTTRRCLDDGHYFCSGTSVVRSRKGGSKRVRKHQACTSEFDYAGWKDWGVWKRNLLLLSEQQRQQSRLKNVRGPIESMFEADSDDDSDEDEDMMDVAEIDTVAHITSWRALQQGQQQRQPPPPPKKDCWNRCDYPSECRWGKQFGVATPVQTSFPDLASLSRYNSTHHTEIDMMDAVAEPLVNTKMEKKGVKTHFEHILTAEQQQHVAETLDGIDGVDGDVPLQTTSTTTTTTPILADLTNLITRAQRRHSRSEVSPSPLARVDASARGTRPTISRSLSRETLRRAMLEGSGGIIGAIAGFVGGAWSSRSSSAPPLATRKREENENEMEVESEEKTDGDMVKGERRKSLG
jgi:hypothetical protein